MTATEPRMQHCIQECANCHQICLATIQYCLSKGGKHSEPGHIRLMADCAQICGVSADFMTRGSSRHKLTCGVCAQICAACADDCQTMADDVQMKRCADTCRQCSKSCQEMAG